MHDSMGSVIGLTDGIGSLVNRYQYDPFDNVVSQTEQVPNVFKWLGTVFDSATQLYKMGKRYYSPALGRFTQRDPTESPLDPYGYAGDDPINQSDTSGEL